MYCTLKEKYRQSYFGCASPTDHRSALRSALLWPITSRQRAKAHCWLTSLQPVQAQEISWPYGRDPPTCLDRQLAQPLSMPLRVWASPSRPLLSPVLQWALESQWLLVTSLLKGGESEWSAMFDRTVLGVEPVGTAAAGIGAAAI